jgi:hypothetical protein
MSYTSHPDKRAAERVRAYEPTHYTVEDTGEEQGIITNLSAKGCFIQPGVEHAGRGRLISVRVYLPLSEKGPARPVVLSGRVAYYLPRVGIGVHFEAVTEEQRGGLARLVEYYRTASSRRT